MSLLCALSDGSFSFHALHPILGKLRAFLRPSQGQEGLKNISTQTAHSLIFLLNEQICSIEKEENSFRDFAFLVGLSSYMEGFCFAVARAVLVERMQLLALFSCFLHLS